MRTINVSCIQLVTINVSYIPLVTINVFFYPSFNNLSFLYWCFLYLSSNNNVYNASLLISNIPYIPFINVSSFSLRKSKVSYIPLLTTNVSYIPPLTINVSYILLLTQSREKLIAVSTVAIKRKISNYFMKSKLKKFDLYRCEF